MRTGLLIVRQARSASGGHRLRVVSEQHIDGCWIQDFNQLATPPIGAVPKKLEAAVWVVGAGDDNTCTSEARAGHGREASSLSWEVRPLGIRNCHHEDTADLA
jgi:hypothetical protein